MLQGDHDSAGVYSEDAAPLFYDTNESVAVKDAPLRIRAYCRVGGTYLAIPSFTATLVFELTQLDATVTRQFN